jgi:hypothetical protein
MIIAPQSVSLSLIPIPHARLGPREQSTDNLIWSWHRHAAPDAQIAKSEHVGHDRISTVLAALVHMLPDGLNIAERTESVYPIDLNVLRSLRSTDISLPCCPAQTPTSPQSSQRWYPSNGPVFTTAKRLPD